MRVEALESAHDRPETLSKIGNGELCFSPTGFDQICNLLTKAVDKLREQQEKLGTAHSASNNGDSARP